MIGRLVTSFIMEPLVYPPHLSHVEAAFRQKSLIRFLQHNTSQVGYCCKSNAYFLLKCSYSCFPKLPKGFK